MALEPQMRRELFKSVRLWTLALICAAAGAYVVWLTDQVGPGVLAFLAALVVFGVPLWVYERARRRRDEREAAARSRTSRR